MRCPTCLNKLPAPLASAEMRTKKTRISIMIDDEILEAFRLMASADATPYQTMINATLRTSIEARIKVLAGEASARRGRLDPQTEDDTR